MQRAGTMQLTSRDGKTFLEKNLTDWKKPYLTTHFDDKEEDEQQSGAAKSKLSKHTTMKGTAKEADAFFKDVGKPDSDAQTRGQQKKIDEINSEKPPTKKAKMVKAGTMAVTAKEGKALLSGEKLGDTRLNTKVKRKVPMRKGTTIQKTMDEAKAIFGDIDVSSGRQLRKRSNASRTPMKKAGTMVKTVQEGKKFLKKSKQSK